MMTAVILYWLVKEEIQLVMDEIGKRGQKVFWLLSLKRL